jgi:alpha-tubulin suppressor-like RCC1 family protein
MIHRLFRTVARATLFGALAGLGAASPTVTLSGPARTVLTPGGSTTLGVTATGSGAVTYQWRRSGKEIGGATGDTLAITNASVADGGWYVVDVTDSTGTTRSKPMFLTVAPTLTQVRYWGVGNGDISGPSTLGNIIDLQVGASSIQALRRDGTLAGWRYGGHTGSTPALAVTDLVAIAAGAQLVMLKSDGQVVTADYWAATLTPVAIAGDVVKVAASGNHALALRSDGTVVGWAFNTYPNYDYLTVPPAGLTGVVAIAAGNYCSLALKSDGTVVAWGSSSGFGEINLPAGLTGVTQISLGGGATPIALKSDGTVVAWGNGYEGKTTVPSGVTGIVHVAEAGDHMFALSSTGVIHGWGRNTVGQATAPVDLAQVMALTGGSGFSYALRDASGDTVPAITSQPAGLVRAEDTSATFSVAVSGAGPFTYQWRRDEVAIAGATASTLTLRELLPSESATYDVVISNHIGSTVSNGAVLMVEPVPVVTDLSASRQILEPGDDLNLQVAATGTGALQFQWFHNGRAIPGADAASYSRLGAGMKESGYYWVEITDDNGVRRGKTIFATVAPAASRVVARGSGGYGQPYVPAAGITDIVDVKTNGSTTLFLHKNGTVTASGEHAYLLPAGVTDAVAIAMGWRFFCILKSDGTVVSAGVFGSSAPAGLKNVVAIAAGEDFACALKNDGSIVPWGRSGLNDLIPSYQTGIVGIVASFNDLFALTQDGAIRHWDTYYSGDSINGNRWRPPLDISSGQKLFAGRGIHYVLTAESELFGWGADYRSAARAPKGLQGIRVLAPGANHTLALLDHGDVLAWGDNTNGQLNVPSGISAFAVSAGGNVSYILGEAGNSGAPVFDTQPFAVTSVAGGHAQLAVSAKGDDTLGYAWQTAPFGSGSWSNLADGSQCAGTQTATLRLRNVPAEWNGNAYRCVVTNGAGTATSEAVALTVHPALQISQVGPARNVAVPGDTASFSVSATGFGALSYQWRHNGRVLPGATGSTWTKSGLVWTDGGHYTVDVTDANGDKTSPPFFLSVSPLATQVRAWGWESTLPLDLEDFTAVSAGPRPLGLRRDGSVVLVHKSDDYSENFFLAGLSDVVSIARAWDATGGNSSALMVLKSDGTVVTRVQGSGLIINSPEGANVAALASQGQNVLVKSDRTVVVRNAGNAYVVDHLENATAALRNVVALAETSGANGSGLVLKENGTLIGWGNGGTYQLTAVPAGLSGVVGVAMSWSHALALKSDGTVVAWGNNADGQTSVPVGLDNVVAVAAGDAHSLALKSDGTVVAWGSNQFGESAVPPGMGGVMSISANGRLSIALRERSGSLPLIVQQPASRGVIGYSASTFSVGASGAGALRYQWQARDPVFGTDWLVVNEGISWGGRLSGINTPNLAVTEANGSCLYRCLISNDAGTVVSSEALMTVSFDAPVIDIQPVGQSFETGDILQLSVVASAYETPSSSLTYQWRRNGVNLTNGGRISGADSATLTIANSQAGDAAVYDVVVAMVGGGSVISDPALLTLLDGYGVWRGDSFTAGELADTSVSGPNADPDADGFANLLEYALGFEPKTADTSNLPTVSVEGSDWVYTMARPADRTDITYVVEISTNLAGWSTAGVVHQFVSDSGGIETWRARYPVASSPNVFFRLRVTQP